MSWIGCRRLGGYKFSEKCVFFSWSVCRIRWYEFLKVISSEKRRRDMETERAKRQAKWGELCFENFAFLSLENGGTFPVAEFCSEVGRLRRRFKFLHSLYLLVDCVSEFSQKRWFINFYFGSAPTESSWELADVWRLMVASCEDEKLNRDNAARRSKIGAICLIIRKSNRKYDIYRLITMGIGTVCRTKWVKLSPLSTRIMWIYSFYIIGTAIRI